MRAVGFYEPGPIDRPDALVPLHLPDPAPGPNDLLVAVSAIAVNPVDTKVRRSRAPQPGTACVPGWDAVGTVLEAGPATVGFAPGDRVYFAGAIDRPGAYAERCAVDARLAARAPATLDDAHAAALPLTTITAWELLFDRFGVAEGGGAGEVLLIIGAAGGVGSMLTSLARALTRLTIVAGASRPESAAWVRGRGAHHVLDHSAPLGPQYAALGLPAPRWVTALTASASHWPALVEAAAPFGRIALIDDPGAPLDLTLLKRKSLSLHWELMFTRSLYALPDMGAQGALLARTAALVDAGVLTTPFAACLGPINAANLTAAHRRIESGRTIGKLTLAGWDAG